MWGRALWSVKVTEGFGIERFSHVMHISSNVEGRLADGLYALVGGFPAGTLSGAPKVRGDRDHRGTGARPAQHPRGLHRLSPGCGDTWQGAPAFSIRPRFLPRSIAFGLEMRRHETCGWMVEDKDHTRNACVAGDWQIHRGGR
jgi:hypothetical protein